jgi:DNA-binding beta-propeller fold protein YncE
MRLSMCDHACKCTVNDVMSYVIAMKNWLDYLKYLHKCIIFYKILRRRVSEMKRLTVLLCTVMCFCNIGLFVSAADNPDHFDNSTCWSHRVGAITPAGIAADRYGRIYVNVYNKHCIFLLTCYGEFITRWGSKGSKNGQFLFPEQLSIDKAGNIYVADSGNHRIQKFTSKGVFIKKWGRQGKAPGQFFFPKGIAIGPAGYVYVVDYGNHRIQKFTSDGEFITKWGRQGGESGQFFCPLSLAVDLGGSVYVADTMNFRIQKFSTNGVFLAQWGTKGTGDCEFNSPRGIAVDSLGLVYVADSLNHRLQVFSSEGVFLGKWGGRGKKKGRMLCPCSVAIDSSGNIFVGETLNHRIQKFTSNAYSYEINPLMESYDFTEDTGNVRVQASNLLKWHAKSNNHWITVMSGDSGIGNGTLKYSVALNFSTEPRIGTITIGRQIFTIKQDGNPCCD